MRLFVLLFALAVGALALGTAAGSAGLGWPSEEIVLGVRLPRALAGFGAGAALALAGALMQLLTRNALADPYVLGVAGGASAGALGLMLVAVTAGWVLPEWAIPLAAAMGAGAASALLFVLSWRLLGRGGQAAGAEAPIALLLIGVMIGAACSAMVSTLLALAPEAPLRGMVFWLLGDLNGANRFAAPWLATLAALALVWPRARELDWLARGDAWAATLGVSVARRRRVALAAAAIATGAAVATAGAIGFVGLVVPHALRLAGLRDAARLLPASAIGGGAFVVLADTAARTVVAPIQLPVGVVCAAVGVPAFLALLLHGPGGARR
jgi:iron complex transport system permease protein